MRCWTRLVEWAEEDRLSAAFYMRLSQAARGAEGSAGLWRNPELELGLRWRRDNQPTAAWARRFDDRSTARWRSSIAASRSASASEAERSGSASGSFAGAVDRGRVRCAVRRSPALAFIARRENRRATRICGLAKDAVDQTLSSAGLDPASAGADVPQMTSSGGELLEKAKVFYVEFLKQEPQRSASPARWRMAHLRLGHIDRWLEEADDAAREYRKPSASSTAWQANPARGYRQGRANAYNWLGRRLTPMPDRAADAEKAYDSALGLQDELVRASPRVPTTARTLRARATTAGSSVPRPADPGSAEFAATESDFREAIRLLEPLAGRQADPCLARARARVQQPRDAAALDDNASRGGETVYEAAVRARRGADEGGPGQSRIQAGAGQVLQQPVVSARAARRRRSREGAEPGGAGSARRAGAAGAVARHRAGRRPQPARPASADAGSARGADASIPQAFESMRVMARQNGPLWRRLHQRYQDFMLNLARLDRESRAPAVHALLMRAVTGYLELAQTSLAAGAAAGTRSRSSGTCRTCCRSSPSVTAHP